MLLFGILAAGLLTATSPIVFASGSRFSNAKRHNAESVCKVEAWVRAEDLYPNAMAKGTLPRQSGVDLNIYLCTVRVYRRPSVKNHFLHRRGHVYSLTATTGRI